MAFIIADRVRESSVSTGTGNFTLAGAVTGYQTFASVMATSDTTYYTIADQGGANWEVGIGTFTSPSTLARTTILSSSNSGSVVTFGAGTKDVFISLPASKTNVEDQPNLIEVNSSSAALRITQTGAGNALVVEDSANPDSTPFVVNASGQVLIGRTTAPFGTTQLGIEQIGANTQAAAQDFLKNRAGATIASGDGVGQLRFWGYDGTSNEQVAAITAIAEGTITTGDVPGRIVFSTRQQSTASVSERMRIDSNGNVGIGTSSPTATLNVVANTSSDALRITQTGAGNALVVEDSTNPDSTPFVVNAEGRLIVGSTQTQPSLGATNTPSIGVFGNSTSNNGFGNYSYTASTAGSFFNFVKSRSVTPGSFSILTSADDLGYIKFVGDDGTQFVEAARIWSEVDGTPAVNDMPGRILFSTTPAGSSTPVERMRIGSTGNIGIGTAGTEPFTIRNLRNFSGATSAYGISQGGEIQSAVTANAYVNHTAPTTQATAFTLSNVYHYVAASLSIGAGSTVTSQYGFSAGSGLTAATNNYGFHSNIASGTGRWNFYANGTADNYFAGQVQLGAGTVAAPALSTTGDTNTGIFFPAADTVAISTAGTEDFRIGPAGQIGLQGANYGTSGQVLTSNGAAAAPSWNTVSASKAAETQTFNSSGTWTKPSGYGASAKAFLQVFAGGGSGGRLNTGGGGGGGGGGGYSEAWVLLSSLGATETITIGAGGAAVSTNVSGNAGGTSSIGSIISAYGGAGGGTGDGGGGGGQFTAGSASTGGLAGGGSPGTGGSPCNAAGKGGSTTFGGGGGGGNGNTVAAAAGGDAMYGGGGGGGAASGSPGAGGKSYNGGAGGAGSTSTGTAGTAPSGGGGGGRSGSSGAGASGRVIITVFDGV